MAEVRTLGGRYEVHRLLGRGGMAEVHEGVDKRLGRRVAIKLLRSDLARDPSFHERLRREAQAAARLNHPAIVAVYDSGEEHVSDDSEGPVQVPYIVMEYVEGKTLREVLTEHGPLTVQESLDVIAGVLAPLRHSHDQGIVHRDIKPANVMLTPEGDVKVMDFGIARALADNSGVTQTSAVVGTAQYLSPEQARGEIVDTRTDLYSTACLLYELLTGRPPFIGDTPLSVAYQHVGETPAPPSTVVSGIPESVDKLVLHGLAKDRDDRYQSARDFREDALAARDGRPLSIEGGDALATQAMATQAQAEPQTAPATVAMSASEASPETGNFQQVMGRAPETDEELEKPEKSRKGWWTLAIILLILAFGALGFFIWQLNHEPEPQVITMEDLVEREPAEAKAYLEQQEMQLQITEEEEPSVDVAEGLVSRTDPQAGEQVTEGDAIILYVSTGPEEVEVPDVSEQTEARARDMIQQAGLQAGQNIEESHPTIPRGSVIETRPEAGEKISPDKIVDLVLSTGMVEVPDVGGATSADEACSQIEDAGLTCTTEEVETGDQDPGTVVSQSPSAGQEVEQKSTVTVQIAKEPPPPPTTEPTTPPEDDDDDEPFTWPTIDDTATGGENGRDQVPGREP